MSRHFPVVALLALAIGSIAYAQKPPQKPTQQPTQQPRQSPGEAKADSRVKSAMKTIGLDYLILDDGAFQVTYAIDSVRTQVAFVNSWTDSLGKLEIREITSTGYKFTGKIPVELADRLLRANDRQKLGAWRIFDEDGSTYAVYAIQLAANANAETLDLVLQTVTVVADALEQELTGKDDF
jgi:hypothetical protein